MTIKLAGVRARNDQGTQGSIPAETTQKKGPLLHVSLFVIAAGIFTQAILAGMFLSMTADARMAHVIVAAVLPYFAIIPTVSAWRRANRGEVTKSVAVGTTLLMVGLWVQEALGHMPWPVTTAIHVPFGVLLFALALFLGYRAYQGRSNG